MLELHFRTSPLRKSWRITSKAKFPGINLPFHVGDETRYQGKLAWRHLRSRVRKVSHFPGQMAEDLDFSTGFPRMGKILGNQVRNIMFLV